MIPFFLHRHKQIVASKVANKLVIKDAEKDIRCQTVKLPQK